MFLPRNINNKVGKKVEQTLPKGKYKDPLNMKRCKPHWSVGKCKFKPRWGVHPPN